MEFHGTREYGKSSMEFHGTLNLDQTPWSSMDHEVLLLNFHGIQFLKSTILRSYNTRVILTPTLSSRQSWHYVSVNSGRFQLFGENNRAISRAHRIWNTDRMESPPFNCSNTLSKTSE